MNGMKIDDLYRLLESLETGNRDRFHGDRDQAIIDAIKELIELKE